MNLSTTIVPKSTQLNADDLISGPITVRITAVKAGSAEQPVAIHYGGDNNRPYLPSKSMRRVLVNAWGAEASAYVGRSLKLYRDPNIKFGGEPVGGICISHMSDIPAPVEIALTVTRGKRKPFRVEPLAPEPASEPIDVQSLVDIGDTKAAEGREALSAWWQSLSAAAKAALKDRVPTWKERVK